MPTPSTEALLAILERNHPWWLCEHEALHEALLAYRHTDSELNAAYTAWLESLKSCNPADVLQPMPDNDHRPVFEQGSMWNGGGRWEYRRPDRSRSMYPWVGDGADE